jgi:hypothetical protein
MVGRELSCANIRKGDDSMKRTTPLKAIRAKCLDCCCHQARYVRDCNIRECTLWPFRMGRGYENPLGSRVSEAMEDAPEGEA